MNELIYDHLLHGYFLTSRFFFFIQLFIQECMNTVYIYFYITPKGGTSDGEKENLEGRRRRCIIYL